MDTVRVLWVPSCTMPLLKIGDMEHVVQDHVEKSEYLQR